jgi:hypothetical protein
MISAQTRYGVTIPRAFADRKAALAWAELNAKDYPGCRIVQATATGPRTIWKHTEQAAA